MRFYPFALLLLICCRTKMYAQKTTAESGSPFLPREYVVFADDFSTDKGGMFPAGWDTVACGYHTGYKWTVKKEEQGNVLLMNTAFTHITPAADLTRYLSDSFTVACDYLIDNNLSQLSVSLMPERHAASYGTRTSCHRFSIYIDGQGRGGTCIGLSGAQDSAKGPHHNNNYIFQGKLDALQWHHLGISYKKRSVSAFIDGQKVIAIDDCGYTPIAILFNGIAPLKLKAIKIATGPYASSLQTLLSGKPVVTHSILFATGTATLNAASNQYIEEMAQLLTAHPDLKLSIYGHTDNIGGNSENQLLSERRAEAVKDALIKKGIASVRLKTKGFGASKPIKPGNTDEIRAINRRVEFEPFK